MDGCAWNTNPPASLSLIELKRYSSSDGVGWGCSTFGFPWSPLPILAMCFAVIPLWPSVRPISSAAWTSLFASSEPVPPMQRIYIKSSSIRSGIPFPVTQYWRMCSHRDACLMKEIIFIVYVDIWFYFAARIIRGLGNTSLYFSHTTVFFVLYNTSTIFSA